MTRPRWYVAVPWLEDAVRDAQERQSLTELPALAWLVSRGMLAPVTHASWRHWLLEAGGHADARHMLARCAAGPCVARLAQLDAETVATWACAQPVHLAAAMDHLRLAPLQQARLNTIDCAELAAAVNAHFSARGCELVAFVDGASLLRSMHAIDCQSHDPARVAGHNIHDYMPSGPDGALVRSLMNEIQMVLHEHPVNEARARRNEPAVNSLWLWGFGAPLPAEQSGANAPQATAQPAATEPWSSHAPENLTRGRFPSPSSRPGRRESVPGGSARNVLLRDGPAKELGDGPCPRVGSVSAVSELPALRDVPLLADDPWLRGIWSVHGRETSVWTPQNSAPRVARDACIAVCQPPPGDTTAALQEIDNALLAPMRSALAAGELDGIELLIGPRVLQVEASARFKFWRRASTVARLLQ